MIDTNANATNTIPVNVRANPFNEKTAIASVPRNTISMDAVLNEAAKESTGLDKFQISHAAEILKDIFTRQLKMGNAVSLLDIGTLYLAPTGNVSASNPSTNDITGFSAKFTPSQKFQKELDGLSAANIQVTESGPVIAGVENTHTKAADGTVFATFGARLTGKNLKLGGEKSGVWFAKVDEAGDQPLADESEWVKVEGDYITRNMPSEIVLDLPRTLEANAKYRVVLRTNLSGGKSLKGFSQAVSETVKVVES